MHASKVRLAARNNALWCDAVCRAHGVPGEFFPTVWLNRSAPPPFHSNLIVVSDSGVHDSTLEHIRDLMSLPLAANWAVKDSFFNLELGPLGFDPLFQATWIWREPGVDAAGGVSTDVRWSRVTASEELANWEASWAGHSRNSGARSASPQFPGSLLKDAEHAFIAGLRGREIVAGGIANRTGNVVGLSNVFVSSGETIAAWTGLVTAIEQAFPDFPLVGYEGGAALDAALACGFEAIGPLRIWARHE